MGQTESKASQITPTISPMIAHFGFPKRFVASYKKSWTKLSILINEPDKEPTYIITLALGAYGDMVLHAGPTKDDAPLANAKATGKWGQDFVITLPARPGDTAESRQEIVRYKAALKNEQFWFGFEVGEGPDRHMERFEWRHSHGSEVRSLGRSKWGWKLVRMNDLSEDPERVVEDGPDREDGFTSDGKEIVAVWADANLKSGMFKIGEFEFRGAGATGEFGKHWGLMAVMSYMCIWQKYYQAMTTAAAVS